MAKRRITFQKLLNEKGWKGMVIYAVLGIVAAVVLNAALGTVLGTSFPVVTVSSTSMVPTLNVGDLVIIEGRGSYELGDIIVFKGWEDRPIIHRVVAKYENGTAMKKQGWDELTAHDIQQRAAGSDVIYITRGDANPTCDQCAPHRPAVAPAQIQGRTIFSVPYLGFVKLYAVQYVWNPLTGR
ncbi:MAG: signal peptidase I [Candidatus Aenigmatarchaeota archaeon]|nr:MAG: signal peptidase I [Candidatus Aenigmarchaeota archaeon]